MDRWIDQFAELPKEKQGRIGDYLLKQGLIDRFDLNWALRYAQEKARPLGEVLVELNLATPLQIQQALEYQRDQEAKRTKLHR
jgi:type IV pilus assembly protein PilB